MKALKIIGITLFTVIVLYAMVALLAPKSFDVKRKIVVNASSELVFKQVNSFKNWERWSPWIKKDSTIKNTYSGPEEGVGNKMTWTSKKSGNGSMEIIESKPATYIRNQLQFGGMTPFESHFEFKPVDGGTEVSWTDTGSFGLLWAPINMFADKMMGPDFEAGLQNLKKQVESTPLWKLGEYKIEELSEQSILSVLDSCPAAEIGNKLGPLYGEIGAVMNKNKLQMTGPVMAYYYSFDPDKVVMEAAIPVAKQIKGEGRVIGKTTPKTKVLTVSFFGDYKYLSQAMPLVIAHMKANKLEWNGVESEAYVTDPTTVKEKIQVETVMHFHIK